MGKIVNRYKDKKIRLYGNEIVDIETGEIINIGNSTLMKRSSTNQITINSKEYVYVDTQILTNLLKKGLRQVDLALLLSLSNNLLINHNICLDDYGEPLKTSTIGLLVNNTVQAVNRKLNRLIQLGLLYYGSYKHYKSSGKVYILNPHIIRKGRYLSSGLPNLFNKLE